MWWPLGEKWEAVRKRSGVGRWAGKHARRVGRVVSEHWLLVGRLLEKNSWFLEQKKRKFRRHHSSRGPVLAIHLCSPDSVPLLQIPEI